MLAAVETKQTLVRGIDLEFIRLGSGRPLLYLHAADGVDQSDVFVGELAKHFDVIAPSHPGFGKSELPRRFRDVDDLAYFYLDFIEQLDLRDITLVGSSFGGWIASEIAVRCTSRLRSIVLAAPMGLSIWNEDEKRILDLISAPIADLPQLLFHDQEKGLAAFGNLDFSKMDEASVTRFVRNREALTLFGWSPVLSSARLPHWIHRIDVPTLLLWGRHDRIVPLQIAEEYQSRLPDTTLSIIEGAGHYMHLERPNEFVSAVKGFTSTR